MTEQKGPIYGVELIDTLPLDGGEMLQAMPSRVDLERVREVSERTVAGYEVLLEHYRRWRRAAEELARYVEPEELARIVDLHPVLESQNP